MRKYRNRVVLSAFVLLILSVCLLCGCTSKSARAQEEAEEKISSGDYEGAAELLDQVMEEYDPEKEGDDQLLVNAGYLKGDCLTKLGKTEEAAAAYDAALEQDLSMTGVEVTATRYLRRALVYMAREDYTSACESLEAGLACTEIECRKELMRYQILCLEKLEDYAAARTVAEQYVALYPDDTEMVKECDFLRTR